MSDRDPETAKAVLFLAGFTVIGGLIGSLFGIPFIQAAFGGLAVGFMVWHFVER